MWVFKLKLNLKFYQISMALNFPFSGVAASFYNNHFVSHLKRSKKNGQGWMFLDEGDIHDDQLEIVCVCLTIL